MDESTSSICPDCGGTGWKPVVANGTRRVARCECWRTRLVDRRQAESRIPRRYQHCTFDNFILYPNELLEKAVRQARRFADAFPLVERGLFFVGPPGIGKSHLAAAVLRQVIATCGARAVFYDVRELLREIRSTFSPDADLRESDVLQPVLRADLLLLDDLGAEKPSEWVGETLNLVVNTRYNEKRPTLFTSNYEVKEDQYDPESLQVRVGFRMYSRLLEMCEFLEFDGADYRHCPSNSGPAELLSAWKNQRRPKLPGRTAGQARAQLKAGRAELKWSGGKAGTA